ncbi:zinc ribbon domain-containing protein [Streptococcus fryi]
MSSLKQFIISKKMKYLLLALAGLCFAGLVAGDLYFSKANVIASYVSARQREDVDIADLKPYLVWADTKEYVTLDEAKYAKFPTLSSDEAEQLKKDLSVATEQDNLYVTSIGKRYWLFSDYRIAMKPFSLTLKTNIPQMDILLNQKKVVTSDSDTFSYELDRLPLAHYEATLSGVYQNKRLEFSKSYDGKNPVIDLAVQFKSFKIVSNLTDAEVMLDKTVIGQLSDGVLSLDHFPITTDGELYVQKRFTDGNIMSEKRLLSQIENGAEVQLDVAHLLDKDEAGRYLVDAFNQFFPYINTKKDPTNLSLFESGSNNGFYKALKKSVEAKLFTDGRLATRLNIPNIWINNIRQVGKESYALDYSAVYNYYYDKATDPVKKTQGEIIQTISGVAILKKTTNGYIFQSTGNSDIGIVNEENKVKAISVFPEGVVGEWEGRSKIDKSRVTIRLSEDGTILKTVVYDDRNKPSVSYSAKVEEVKEVSSGVYLYTGLTGDKEALLIESGLGGTDVTYDFGFRLNGNTLTPIVWQTALGGDVESQQPSSGGTLRKK